MTVAKPIRTQYKGHNFRSRLEARWAVFLDSLGVHWHYESEAFELSNGDRYLPDFYLPQLAGYPKGAFLEIKANCPTDRESKRVDLLVSADRPAAFVACGPPHGRNWGVTGSSGGEAEDDMYSYQWSDEIGTWWDNYHGFLVCPFCHSVTVQFMAKATRGGCCQAARDDADGEHEDETGRLNRAVIAANTARFWDPSPAHSDRPSYLGIAQTAKRDHNG